jgi:hypothetical protein
VVSDSGPLRSVKKIVAAAIEAGYTAPPSPAILSDYPVEQVAWIAMEDTVPGLLAQPLNPDEKAGRPSASLAIWRVC